MKGSSRADILVASTLWLGCMVWLFKAFLGLPQRDILPWDAAMHFKDGYLLYQQLIQGDLISFVVQIFKFSYWLPLHPLLVCLAIFFGGFDFSWPVALNFLALAIGSIWFIQELSAAFGIRSVLTKLSLHVALLGITLQLIIRGILGDYLGQLMLEVLAYSLTLAFWGSAIRAWRSGAQESLRAATILLSALFFTKVHYGIYVLLPWLGYCVLLTLRQSASVKGLWSAMTEFALTIRHSRSFRWAGVMYVLLLVVLGIRSLNKGSIQPIHDWVWLQLFAPLVAWSFFRGKEQFYRLFGDHWRPLSRYFVVPFGWLYLFPIKHKVATFFELSRHNGDLIPFSKRVIVLWERLADHYFLAPMGFTLVLSVMGVGLGVWMAWRKREHWAIALLGFLGLFYFMMSFMSHRHEDRILFPWVAGWVALFFGSVVALSESRAKGMAAGGFLVSLAAVVGLVGNAPSTVQDLLERWGRHYLSAEHLQIGAFRQLYRFDHPGIIYGLGMDQVVPMLDLWCRKEFPKMSSYLIARDRSPCFANDFGKSGSSDPVGFIQRKTSEPQFKQVALFSVDGAERIPAIQDVLARAGFSRTDQRAGAWELWKRNQ